MSHMTTVKCMLKSLEYINKALANLKMEVAYNTTIRGYGGQTQMVNIAVKSKVGGNYDIGFVKNEAGTYDIVCDPFIVRNSRELIAQFKREYNNTLIITEAKKKGYMLQSNGKKQLVMIKY